MGPRSTMGQGQGRRKIGSRAWPAGAGPRWVVSAPPLLEVKGTAADSPLSCRSVGGAVSGVGGPPAHLKVIAGGTTLFFEMPGDVWQWLEMWDKVPKFKVGRTEMHERTLRGNCDADGSHAVSTPWSPTGSQDGRVDIQADGTMALAAVDQSDVVPAGMLMNQQLTVLRGSGAEDNIC
ncbi:hypothetical protein NDU88_009863 [Pleurodeles waltl]|uniref:Uncharacterized protein n=1 Tax=Pleurodeles waltl TaxID=8319 RepID=A0AAV7RYX5_PLEWA|nr:hypothetical protein NDU88_009863 [Pleurodeles waltl]